MLNTPHLKLGYDNFFLKSILGMVTRGSGVIINLSSFLAFGGPLLSVYAASKAFVRQFSEDLQLEYKNTGSDFERQELCRVCTF